MYLWRLSASDYGNAFYAAAAQAGSQSWSAWFFGSLDANDFITVDKPPASLWVAGLSVRLFGLDSWSVLVPQALMGVAAVAVLFATVRRVVPDPGQGAAAGLIAGAVLACTPAAALMFRFNNPDALLCLLLVLAAYCLARAVQAGSWRWLGLVGVVIGMAFLTKMLQAFLVLPGFGIAYLLTAPTPWRRRVLHVASAVGALLVSAGWWVLVVALTPARDRPYIGGSTDNTVLDLAFGYNGISRIVGQKSGWGAATVRSMNDTTGIHRLFITEMGNEISWLLPVAGVAVVFGGYLGLRGRLGRDEWAAVVSWGGWLVVTAAVFGYMRGTTHPYYTVVLAPAIGALIGLASVWAWRLRSAWDGRIALVAMLGLGAWWSSVLLHRNRFGPPWLPVSLLITGIVAAACILFGRRRLLGVGAVAGVVAAAAGTVAFSVATAATPHFGAIPIAVSLVPATSGPAGRVGIGSWTGDEATNADLAAMLTATTTAWSAATNGSQSAAALELATHTSVMAIGGWSGDPAPTLQQFVDDVHARRIAYYVEAGRGGSAQPTGKVIRSENHSASHSRDISDWVADHYRGVSVGTSLVYRLT
jgi:4-amino-4-deoxy-L-arabinose transferase-like glycosyltransferase